MTARIVMVCHGSTEALHRAAFPLDEGLDEQGRRQVADAARLFGTGSGRSLCGPSLRCRQTAAGLGLAAEPDEGLRDCDNGHWAGRTLADLQGQDPEGMMAWLTNPSAAPHGGESVLTLVGRVAAWLERRHQEGGKVVAVTHPAVMRAAVVHVLGTPPEAFWRIDAEPLSQVRLTAHGGRWRLRLSPAS
ncbi:histidine phosphatase family protein [Sphaerisporangium sp. NBC_01403]|uniref:histidine phosphatase family protein n=1 Tax=Sphaerisporangium sp. NBC_01403 TaxID=2903599 RepID=UPI00324E749D